MTTGQSLECHLPAPAAIRKCDGKMLIQKDSKEDTLLSKDAKNDNTLIKGSWAPCARNANRYNYAKAVETKLQTA